MVIRPNLVEALGYNSNAEGFRGGRGSPSLQTSGTVNAMTDWSRDSAYLSASVVDQRYTALPHQDFTNYTVGLGGTIDVGRDKIGATYTHLQLTQTPGSIDAVTVAQPVTFRVDRAQLSYTASSLGRFTFVPALDVAKYDFDNYVIGQQTVSQAYRNRVVLQAGGDDEVRDRPATQPAAGHPRHPQQLRRRCARRPPARLDRRCGPGRHRAPSLELQPPVPRVGRGAGALLRRQGLRQARLTHGGGGRDLHAHSP